MGVLDAAAVRVRAGADARVHPIAALPPTHNPHPRLPLLRNKALLKITGHHGNWTFVIIRGPPAADPPKNIANIALRRDTLRVEAAHRFT